MTDKSKQNGGASKGASSFKRHPLSEDFKKKLNPPGISADATRIDELRERSQAILLRGQEAGRARREVFNEAYGDILTDIFDAWIHSEPQNVKEREYLYQCAMLLGQLKGKLLTYETLAGNIQHLQPQPEEAGEDSSGWGGESQE